MKNTQTMYWLSNYQSTCDTLGDLLEESSEDIAHQLAERAYRLAQEDGGNEQEDDVPLADLLEDLPAMLKKSGVQW